MTDQSTQRQLDVLVGEVLVGQLRFTHEGRREHSAFTYTDSFLSEHARFEIDPTLPLVAGPQFPPHTKLADASRFHSAIADTEPDGWARRVILRDHAKRRQAAKAAGESLPPLATALDFLLAVDDYARIGALRFRDAHGICLRASAHGKRTAPPLLELPDLLRASRAVEQQTETLSDLEYLRGRATSVGGMRPKCSVRDDHWGLCLGKFPSVSDERPYTTGEVLALRLAHRAGISAAEARLVNSDGVAVTVVRRFDRVWDATANEERRLLYVSAATLMGLAPGTDTESSYTDMADVIRQRSADATADLEELWRRVAFSILITNVDDHLHNHGFLHVQAALWRLSPAFDVNPFPDRVRELKTWISDEEGPEASIAALMGVSTYFGLSRARAAVVLGDVESAVAGWREEAVLLGMTDADIDSFADAFEHHERAVAQRLMSQ